MHVHELRGPSLCHPYALGILSVSPSQGNRGQWDAVPQPHLQLPSAGSSGSASIPQHSACVSYHGYVSTGGHSQHASLPHLPPAGLSRGCSCVCIRPALHHALQNSREAAGVLKGLGHSRHEQLCACPACSQEHAGTLATWESSCRMCLAAGCRQVRQRLWLCGCVSAMLWCAVLGGSPAHQTCRQ